MVSANIRRDAIPAEMLAQQEQIGSAAVEFMKDTPMYQLYQRVAPRPQDFGRLLDKIGASMSSDFDFSEELRGIQVPTMIVCADADMAPPSHYVEAFKLLDGGLRDGGWMAEGRVVEAHRAGAMEQDLVGGPTGLELRAPRREPADQVGQGAVGGISAGLGSQEGDHVVGGGLPVDGERPRARVQEDETRRV